MQPCEAFEMGHSSPQLLGAVLAAATAALVYLNTLPAGFVFDDGFAVVSVRRRWSLRMEMIRSLVTIMGLLHARAPPTHNAGEQQGRDG